MQSPVLIKLSEADHTAFHKLHWRGQSGRLAIAAVLIAAAAALFGVAGGSRFHEAIVPVLVGILAGAVFWVLYYLMILPAQSRKIFSETAFLQEEQRWTLLSDGAEIAQPSGNARILWTNIVRWNEDEHVFVCYANRMLGYIIPKRRVDPVFIDHIRAALIESGLHEKRTMRK